jgi:hypothetical protein
MSTTPFPNSWNDLANSIGTQGQAFNQPLSPSGNYVAFLSKADQDWETGLWDILFEVVPQEWAMNALVTGSEEVRIIAPQGPASLYHIPTVTESALLQMLGLKSTDDLAEGSWYMLQLQKQNEGTINGMLYDPDIDMER